MIAFWAREVFSLAPFDEYFFDFSKRPLVIFNYEIRELVFSDFIAKIYPFRQYLYLYTIIVCSTYYKYLFRPYLYFCTSAIQI